MRRMFVAVAVAALYVAVLGLIGTGVFADGGDPPAPLILIPVESPTDIVEAIVAGGDAYAPVEVQINMFTSQHGGMFINHGDYAAGTDPGPIMSSNTVMGNLSSLSAGCGECVTNAGSSLQINAWSGQSATTVIEDVSAAGTDARQLVAGNARYSISTLTTP